jgi:dCTP deaminase
MMLGADEIARRLTSTDNADKVDPLVVTPFFDIEQLRSSGAASIDLRLGTWVVSMRQSRCPVLAVEGDMESAAKKANLTADQQQIIEDSVYGGKATESRLTRMQYVPFGTSYILHPRNFVLGVTLEWIRIPRTLGGYVVGRSSWGRRGLIIATAVGVHPGFTGCLTLELSNVGELPIALKPGMPVCQLFLHQVTSRSGEADKSAFFGKRRPNLGSVSPDKFAEKLSSPF